MKVETKDGGPACPIVAGNLVECLGMSKRDWFAGMSDVSGALPLLHKEGCEALVGQPYPSHDDMAAVVRWHFDVIAAVRFIAADAMLAARGGK
jgi:hypothetical protein